MREEDTNYLKGHLRCLPAHYTFKVLKSTGGKPHCRVRHAKNSTHAVHSDCTGVTEGC